jgi:Eco57I restriction-modification methylase
VPLEAERARHHLSDFQLETLFVEDLGWDRYTGHLTIAVDGDSYKLRGIAQKRGMAAFVVDSNSKGIPDYATRRKIERHVAKSVHEHLIVYADQAQTTQVWQWVRREPGRPTACRELHYQRGQSGEALIQRLDAVTFTLDEEAELSIVDVTRRARAAFDVERVTKRFYDRFKSEHDAFLGFIRGLKSQEDVEWYASVMLNRLMFVYFIQKKGFLDGDRDYLRHRLESVQADAGRDQFHSFYRHFLLRLFHEGLGQSGGSSDLDALLGRVPYLNGGLFDIHELERENEDIDIPDEAFERLFDFFDAYQWHLDDRPLRSDNEINPDVLGYIFEKYVNQKQMGAYYTKEDITEYITVNTLIPRLFEKLAANSDEFKVKTVADLLATDPDRYIHDALRHGQDNELRDEIAVGVENPSQRERWNDQASAGYALPTEIWREVVARRQYYARVHDALRRGELHSFEDLVSLNLDLQQLARDVIVVCDSPTLLVSIYRSLESLSVLDPTCGSGAFLFSALNTLEPLYEAALERMSAFILDGEAEEESAEFAAITARVEAHGSRTFFILKTIVVNNLYGVDIMEEAVEICKLRLFLRLVSQVDRYEHLEPLPDVDFKVRAGNALVGFGQASEVERAFAERLDLGGSTDQLRESTESVEALYNEFQRLQTDVNVDDTDTVEVKAKLRATLATLDGQLDSYLAAQYGIHPSASSEFAAWRGSHQPLHWLVDFHHVTRQGGFDCVIGNPPYVEYRKVRDQYSVQSFKTEPCGDLYAFVMERATQLLAERGSFGMIVPVSVVSTDRFDELRNVLLGSFAGSWVLNFAERPSKLFTGVEKRLTIWLGHRGDGPPRMHVSRYRRWFAEERPHLFATASFVEADHEARLVGSAIPKVSTLEELEILEVLADQKPIASFIRRASELVIYYTRKLRYFVVFLDFIPGIRDDTGQELKPSELKEVRVGTPSELQSLLAALNSSLFFWFFTAFSDVRNVNRREILAFRCSLDEVAEATAQELGRLSRDLMDDFRDRSRWLTSDYGKFGVLTIQSFQPRLSKPLIDQIDQALAVHYGLSDEQVDLLINFDIKYRLGLAVGEEQDTTSP